MTATRQWYPHYVRDFKAKTGHLSLTERGAYRALMDEYWERQGPLPADERALCRLVGAYPDEWEQVRVAVLAFFVERDGLLHHKRIDEEIEKASKQHREKSERMANARSKRWVHNNQSADQITDQYTDQNTEQISSAPTPSPSPTPKNVRTEEPSIGAVAPGDVSRETNRGKRLSEDWKPPSEFIAWAVENENLTEAEALREADQFRDYWIAETGAKSAKRDWFATWRNRIRAVAPRIRKARTSGANGGAGSGYARHADPVEVRNRLLRELAEKEDVSTDGRELRSVARR